jgi:hypothetical protein
LTLHLTGGIHNGKMIMEGFSDNGKTHNKITWSTLENGDVRQFWEVRDSNSIQDEWNTIVDLEYKKKK